MKLPEWGSGIGKHILRLNDGDVKPGVFRGDIVRFYSHWKNNQASICPGKDKCEDCAAGDKGSGRFRINFLMLGDGGWEAKIFEGGKRVFEQMKALNNDMPLEKAKIKISRSGIGKQAITQVSIYPGEQGIIDEKLAKTLSEVKLIDLAATIAIDAA